MCTAISFTGKSHYFGRNLDVDQAYGECITITPRNYNLNFKHNLSCNSHYAIIGIATVVDNTPLYFDAINEKGLCIAALNFPLFAYYHNIQSGFCNIAPFEFIPYILSKCESTKEAEHLIKRINITDIPFNKDLPVTPLHWIISDRERSITAEPLQTGLKLYDNPIGVLTNSPTFDMQMLNLENYTNVTNKSINPTKEKASYSRGLGAIGLPGDYSSMSRFVKAHFVKKYTVSYDNREKEISQYFHILNSVAMPEGAVITENGNYEKTSYMSCCDTANGIYYYKTYNSHTISSVKMRNENLNINTLITYPLIDELKIVNQN